MAVDPSRHGSALSRLLAILLLAGMAPLWAAPDRASPTNPGGSAIDGNSIRKLERELGDAAAIESTTERRRLLKNVVRHALALVERQPDSPNRFQVLGWVFEAQRELLLMRNDPRSQEDLLETCRQLVAAPDAYAGERLQAEILLLQLDLDTRGATDHQRAVAIAELADRYRNTEAEVDSLMLASELASISGRPTCWARFDIPCHANSRRTTRRLSSCGSDSHSTATASSFGAASSGRTAR